MELQTKGFRVISNKRGGGKALKAAHFKGRELELRQFVKNQKRLITSKWQPISSIAIFNSGKKKSCDT